MTILRTGAEVPDSLTPVVMLSLKKLAADDPIALFELVELARDPSHKLFGNTGSTLKELALVDGRGKLHGLTRDVILAAAAGGMFVLHLRSPYAEGDDRD